MKNKTPKKETVCEYCGTTNNAHHSAQCVDTNRGTFPHPLDMPPLPPITRQWQITVTVNTSPEPLIRIISGLVGVVEVSSEEI